MKKLSFSLVKKLPSHEKKMTLSTLITLVRIILIPFILTAMQSQYWGTALVLFIIAALTDVADGTLARLRNERTFLGACLDPIADKLLVLSCFFMLAFTKAPLFDIPGWFLALIALRELIMIGGSLTVWVSTGSLVIRPTLLGKATTVLHMGFIAWVFACYYYHWLPIKTYYGMLGVGVVLVTISLGHYIYIGYKQLVP